VISSIGGFLEIFQKNGMKILASGDGRALKCCTGSSSQFIDCQFHKGKVRKAFDGEAWSPDQKLFGE
jgi:hypothetical protein